MRSSLLARVGGVWIATVCLWPTLILGQSTTGSLVGRVGTSEGKPVAEAVVQAHLAATGVVRIGITGEDGEYRIDSLQPGEWTVAARLNDGRASQSHTVLLRLQETVRLNFTVGAGLTEKVTVTAHAPLIDPKETTGKLRVSSQQADNLPLSGRVVTDLAMLDSSVQSAAPGNYFGERGSVFTLNGQSGRSNSFLVDGLDNNDQISGTTTNSFYSQQVIQEFVLMTHQYSPEFGRASGGIMNIVTRSGTNEFDWEVFLQGSASEWNGPGQFVESLPDSGLSTDSGSRLQTGFRLGGPFKKDRSFYFLAYEHQRIEDVVPFVGITRPGERGGTFLAPNEDDNLFFRTDFNLSNTNSLMVRLTYDDRLSSGVNVGGLYTPDAGFTIEEQDFSFGATLTTIVSPRVVNEVRLMGATSDFNQRANSDLSGVSRPSGIFGGNNLNLQLRDEQRLQLLDNVTVRTGDHTLKFGLDVAFSRTQIDTRFNPSGNFIYNSDDAFDSGDCGDIFLNNVFDADRLGLLPLVPCPGTPGFDDDGDGLIDEPANLDSYPAVFMLIFGEPEALLVNTNIALFAQDHWQAGPRVILDYGLRYDLSTFELPSYARVDSTIPNGGASRDINNVAPRVGFTYTPKADGSLVLRGGAGLFYDKLVLGFPAVSAVTSGTRLGLSFPQGFAAEITEDFVEENGIEETIPLLLLNDPFLDELIMRFSTATELNTPYTIQANLGLDWRLGKHSAAGFNVQRARGYNLPLMRDLNPVSGLRTVGVDCREENLDPDLEVGLPCHLGDPSTGSIAAITTDGESWYTGVNLGYRYQGGNAWFSTSYTWSQAEDLGFDPLKGGISLPPDSNDLSAERGRSDGDRRHRFVFSGDTAFPWLGLRVSGVLRLASGLPFNVTTGTDDNLDGILSDRPDGVGRNTGEKTSLDVVNALRAEEDLDPVYSLDEPSFFQVDLRVYRPFPWNKGKGHGVFYLQVINLTDRQNGGLIEGRAISQSFGRVILLAGPPRTFEMGIRIGH